MRYKHCTGQQFILRFISTQDHPVTDVGCVKERGDFKLCDTNITAEVLNLQDNLPPLDNNIINKRYIYSSVIIIIYCKVVCDVYNTL